MHRHRYSPHASWGTSCRRPQHPWGRRSEVSYDTRSQLSVLTRLMNRIFSSLQPCSRRTSIALMHEPPVADCQPRPCLTTHRAWGREEEHNAQRCPRGAWRTAVSLDNQSKPQLTKSFGRVVSSSFMLVHVGREGSEDRGTVVARPSRTLYIVAHTLDQNLYRGVPERSVTIQTAQCLDTPCQCGLQVSDTSCMQD